MLRFYTAGESHGQALLAFISGLPAQLPIDVKFINHELRRRQLRYRRAPPPKTPKSPPPTFAPPPPGHAGCAGWQKFNSPDAGYFLERVSVRETAARVAAGAFAKLLLREFETEIASHTIQVGHVRLEKPATWNKIHAVSADLDSPLRCIDAGVQEKMKAEVDAALKAGDTVGGIFEIVAHNVPVGLGSHAQWDEKLDGRLAQALMSVQAVKGAGIGAGSLAGGSCGHA